MDLRALGALLSAIGGVFSAKAGAKAGQLQGLLMGEDLTERRKRMKMTEEAHQLQTEIARSEERRRSEIHPLQIRGIEQSLEQQAELFPHQRDLLATQKDKAILDLTNTRLWSLYQQGVAPSQISDPVLRQQYEPFFRFRSAVDSLQAVQTQEDLQALLGQVSEELRPTLEIMGRTILQNNQMRTEMLQRQMKGLDINLAQGEFQLRSAKLNHAITAIISNIDREGMDWDKRSPEQRVQAVQKWLAQLGLDDLVPEDFANMFQRVKSTDARQFALFRAQTEMQHRMQVDLMGRQFGYNRALQQDAAMTNLVFGALGGGQGQGGVGGVAPVGFPALPPIPTIFNNTYDNRGSNLNTTALSKYLNSAPFEIFVPFGRGYEPLSVVGAQANAVYQRLGRADATITANDINTLITFEAGLLQSHFAKNGMELGWDNALAWATERVLPTIKSNRAYTTNMNYQQVVNNWEQAWQRKLQRGTASAPAQPPAPTQPPAQPRGGQRGQNPQRPPMTQADIQRERTRREP